MVELTMNEVSCRLLDEFNTKPVLILYRLSAVPVMRKPLYSITLLFLMLEENTMDTNRFVPYRFDELFVVGCKSWILYQYHYFQGNRVCIQHGEKHGDKCEPVFLARDELIKVLEEHRIDVWGWPCYNIWSLKPINSPCRYSAH